MNLKLIRMGFVVCVALSCGVVVSMEQQEENDKQRDEEFLKQHRALLGQCKTNHITLKNKVQGKLVRRGKQQQLRKWKKLIHEEEEAVVNISKKLKKYLSTETNKDKIEDKNVLTLLNTQDNKVDKRRALFMRVTLCLGALTVGSVLFDVIRKKKPSIVSVLCAGAATLSGVLTWYINSTCCTCRATRAKELDVEMKKYKEVYQNINKFVCENEQGEPELQDSVVQPSPWFAFGGEWGAVDKIHLNRHHINHSTTARSLWSVVLDNSCDYEVKDNIALLYKLYAYDRSNSSFKTYYEQKNTAYNNAFLSVGNLYWISRGTRVEDWYNQNGYESVVSKEKPSKIEIHYNK
jgi:hypothetical protein